MKKRILIINKSFLSPTEIWIRRHIEGLKNYYPFVLVHNRTGTNQPLSSGHLLLLDSWLWFIRPANYIAKLLFKIPYYGYEIYLKAVIFFFNIRIVHIHFFWNAIWFFDYIKAVNLPVIVTAHGSDVNYAFADSQYRERLIGIFSKVDRVICVSQFINNKLIELGCQQEKLIVNYLGVPIISLPRNEKSKVDCAMRLICVAAFRPEKGHDMLLNVFSAVLKEYSNCELILVGDGELLNAMKQKLTILAISDNVIFKGWQEQESVFKLLSESDIYVQCSNKYFVDGDVCKEEGLGISPLEAAMIGLPLVLTDVGGVSEVCINEYNGYLCPYGDIDFMKDRIVTLLNNGSIRNAFSENSNVIVRTKFDQEKNLKFLESIYKEEIEMKLAL